MRTANNKTCPPSCFYSSLQLNAIDKNRLFLTYLRRREYKSGKNERKLPEEHHRIDMTVDLHTAVIIMLFAVLMIVSKIVPPPAPPSLFLSLFLSLSLSHLEVFNLEHKNCLIKCYKNIWDLHGFSYEISSISMISHLFSAFSHLFSHLEIFNLDHKNRMINCYKNI